MAGVRLVIEGHHLPGATSAGHKNVHVGIQLGREPAELVRADSPSARWVTEIDLVGRDGRPDFRGPAVQGKRGERFVYLTWGEVSGADFAMFRRAKLMLADAPEVGAGEELAASVHLTDDRGCPRCARLRPPALSWTVVARNG